MELTHDFTVPADVDTTWATFMDLERVGSCFPGATVTEVSEEGFAGTVKVKLGPIALQYAGTGHFVEKDDAAKHAVIEAKGKDKRGNGTAGATVRIQLAPDGTGTRVEVVTDLAVTGKPAQFGRGVMQDVSDKLLGQFVACLEQRLAAPEPTPEPPSGAGDPAPGGDPLAAAASAVPPPKPAAPWPPHPPAQPEALDLGSAVLPVLLKSYWKQALAAVVGLALVRRVLRR